MMNGVTRSLCTFEDIRSQESEGCRRLRLTLHNQSLDRRAEQHRDKPIGRAFALVQPASDRAVLTPEPVKTTEEQVEVIKVYLEARKQEQQKHQESLKMLSDEVSQIQEVRYCLKTLREQMATKNKPLINGWKVSIPFKKSSSSAAKGGAKSDGQEVDEEAERAKLREVSKRLYAQLQEAEKKHQEEKERLQTEGSRLREHLSEQEDRLKTVEEDSERKDQRMQELQRLLGGMEQESAALRETIRNREEELGNLRRMREEGRAGEERAKRLEKEVSVLKEKIHHLDDMLKCQQRKVRHMIEQLQNSRMVIQERDRVIKELEEKVAFLEAENREMHDRMEYFLGGERSNSYLSSERNAQIVYSKPIKPSNSSNKPLPFIKVIEIKS
ncbi:tuftelin 1a [Takifugu rubripes]|uniref:Tuftelin 1a n=1 Tax=Takifugu rubripes TaxID=31033 RepID=A0A3B5KH32_TAKRU|nr:tuftelin [Takifugu rubripes]|eukprot:XP_011604102.1 PREDICTED: tuftelin [Takifugu rubripes]